MTWADRLFRLAVGDPKREIGELLQGVQRRTADQGRRLSAAADQAPTAGAEAELRALATEASMLAAHLAELLARGGPTAAAPEPTSVLNGATRNHWARLVAAMEAGRETRAQLLRATPRLLELDGSLAALLDESLHRL